mmetsp:Transcript_84000/g.186477  ORF Transcript_84000/g.186477 Transcript_84000/m.186477 type:complete len:407 (+) Transcript_84000:1130-2350(+)
MCRSRASRSSSRRLALSFALLASSSMARERASDEARSFLAEASSVSALWRRACASKSSAFSRLAAATSLSIWSRWSCNSACSMLQFWSKWFTSFDLSLSSSCALAMRMFISTFSFLTKRNSSSSSRSRSALPTGKSPRSELTVCWAGPVTSLHCCFSCSKTARWSRSVFRSPVSAPPPRAMPSAMPIDGVTEGRALGADLDSMRERSSVRNWSNDSVREALPFFAISASCWLSLSTFRLEASSSFSTVVTRCRCCCNSAMLLSALFSFSEMASSRSFDVSKSPSKRILSKRICRSSACVASSSCTRKSRAAFCASTLCSWTWSSSCAVLIAPSSLVVCSAWATCFCAASSWAVRWANCASASMVERRRAEASSRKAPTSAKRAPYSSELLVEASSTSSLALSRRNS